MPSIFPKLGPRLSQREGSIFAKKRPKVRKALLIALGMGISAGVGYEVGKRVTRLSEQEAVTHAAQITDTRTEILCIDRDTEEINNQSQESFDL